MEVRKDGAWRTISSAEAYVGGSWRTLRYAEAYIDGEWRKIASFVQALSLSVSGTAAFSSVNPMTTDRSVATPTGGLAPFTYAWTILSQTGLSGLTINSPSSASTTFTASVPSGNNGSATFRCTATDALGTTAHDDVTVGFTKIASGGLE